MIVTFAGTGTSVAFARRVRHGRLIHTLTKASHDRGTTSEYRVVAPEPTSVSEIECVIGISAMDSYLSQRNTCDMITKGGITSGVAWPLAVVATAKSSGSKTLAARRLTQLVLRDRRGGISVANT
jgi:hypothetical protein